MLKFIFNVLQLYLITVFTFKVLKWLVFRKFKVFGKSKKSKGKKQLSITGKIWVLISRQLHSNIDGLLTKQSIYLKDKKEQRKSLVKQIGEAQQDTEEKVIQFSKYRSKVVR